MNRIAAMNYRKKIEQAAVSLPDEDALSAPEIFPHWKSDMDVLIDERYYYVGKLYRVVQTHKTQIGWEPDVTPSLWTEVAMPDEILVWKQPTGAQDAYMKGDKVYYPNKGDTVYESIIDNNIWEPGVYGWI